MKRLHILYLLLLTIAPLGHGQSFISGTIKNEKGDAMENIVVLLKDTANNSIITYGYSDNNGRYKLEYNNKSKEFLLSVSGMNIAKQTKTIKNENQTVNFTVKEESIQLKEVEIKAPKISYRKDTITYSVSAFKTDKDFVIGDVLKRMPGIDVSASGQVRYQGRAINKFYIEDMDMLNGRYGIATRNIAAKDVASVQVLENHQPIKAIDSLQISDQAAINLKLKDEAKGTFSVMSQLGLGISPLLWDNELTGMYFAREKQNITTYKTNNSGNNITTELSSFTSSQRLSAEQYTNIQSPTLPDIAQRRYLFNNTHAVTVNNLFKIGKEKELNFNIIYFNDFEKRESSQRSLYFIENDNSLTIDENIQVRNNTNHLEGEIRYNENSNNCYLNNYLSIKGVWEDDRGSIVQDQKIVQELNRPSLGIQNSFHLIKKNGSSGGFEVQSQIGFQNSPQDLTIYPGLHDDWMNAGKPYSNLKQNIEAFQFKASNQITLLSPFRIGNIVVNPNAGFNVEVNDLYSKLYARDSSGDTLSPVLDDKKNDLAKYHYQPYMGLNFLYKVNKFKFNVHLPVSYNNYRLTNHVQADKNEIVNRFFINPALSMQYKVSYKLDLSLNAGLYNRYNSIYELYSGAILQTYRFLNSYDSRLSRHRGSNVSLQIAYKDVVNMFFAGGGASFNYNKRQIMYSQSFNDILSISTVLNKPNHQNTFNTNGRVNKSFDLMKINTGLEATYSLSSSQQMRQSNLVDYKANFFTLSGKLSAVPVSFVILSYRGTWGKSKSSIESGESFTPINSLTNTVNADFTLFRKAMIGCKFEHYYNSAAQNDKNIYFADININYRWKDFNFSIDWTNIFNTKQYTQAYYSDINEFHYRYNIRHANVLLKVKMKLF